MNSNYKKEYLPSLDALRGIALIMVIISHSGRNYSNILFASISNCAESLWIGVDLFFVLSGFLITRILLETLNKKTGLTKFYVRRILRIFPAYFLLLLIVYTLYPYILNSSEFKGDIKFMQENSIYFWMHSSNLLFLLKPESLFDGTLPFKLGHLWSLSVEEHYYLIYPILLLLIKSKKQLFYIFIFVILTQPILRYFIANFYNVKIAYTLTFNRLDGFAWGGLLSVIIREKWLPHYYINKLALIILTLLFTIATFYGFSPKNMISLVFILPIYYFYFTYLVAYFSLNTISHHKFFKLLCWIGTYCYGLYLFHQPINFFLMFYINPSTKALFLFYPIILFLTTFLVSFVSFELFEKRILKLKKHFEYQYIKLDHNTNNL
jgi:peptidoglycan/LPS O-acetylase OafA/YrhL